MPTVITETMIIETDTSAGDLEVYLNDNNKMFFTNSEVDSTHFWFTLNKSDWESLKQFIDDKFNMVFKSDSGD